MRFAQQCKFWQSSKDGWFKCEKVGNVVLCPKDGIVDAKCWEKGRKRRK